MTDEEIDAISKRAEAATRGPWERMTNPAGHGPCVGKRELGYVEPIAVGLRDETLSDAEADFIAAARTDVVNLVAEVKRLRAQPLIPPGARVEIRPAPIPESAVTDALRAEVARLRARLDCDCGRERSLGDCPVCDHDL